MKFTFLELDTKGVLQWILKYPTNVVNMSFLRGRKNRMLTMTNDLGFQEALHEQKLRTQTEH